MHPNTNFRNIDFNGIPTSPIVGASQTPKRPQSGLKSNNNHGLKLKTSSILQINNSNFVPTLKQS